MRDRLSPVLHAALLGAWLGAAALVSFAVAPAAFEALPTRAEAGSFVGGLLRVVYAGGLVAGGAGILLAGPGRWRALRVALPALVAASAVASLVLAWRIAALREALGPIDAVPADDPGRKTFGMLHGLSVLVLLAGMLAALVAITLEPLGRRA